MIASLVLGVSSAKAIDFDFFGSFTADKDVAIFNFTLAAGNYTVTIAQFDNIAVGSTLTQGFTYDGDPMFTQAFGSAPSFNGVEGEPNQDTGMFEDPRTGDFVFHILSVAEARQGVPDSGLTLVLQGLTVAVLDMFRVRPDRSSDKVYAGAKPTPGWPRARLRFDEQTAREEDATELGSGTELVIGRALW